MAKPTPLLVRIAESRTLKSRLNILSWLGSEFVCEKNRKNPLARATEGLPLSRSKTTEGFHPHAPKLLLDAPFLLFVLVTTLI